MFALFGRKSAPEARPFVPLWLQGESEAGGFVRGYQAQLIGPMAVSRPKSISLTI